MGGLQSSTATPLKVLVVDDDPADRELVRRELGKNTKRFEVFEAGNMAEALDIAKKNEFDCIVVDYRLPADSGLDFMRQRRVSDPDNKTAIIMITGQGSEKTAAEALQLGAADYIQKKSIAEGVFAQHIINAVERSHLKQTVADCKAELERSRKALAEFAYTAAHDLKAPLRHISTYCNYLRQDYASALGEEGLGYANRLIVNVTRMQKLVDNLLSYSRVIDAPEEASDVNVKGLLSEILEEHEESIQAEKAQVIVGDIPIIRGYPIRIRQLLQNLVANAIKYRRADESPVIKIACEDRGNEWLFSVQDNGSGIEAEQCQAIFEPFKRLHSKDAIEGTGLGLSICHKVVDMHGGRIWVESTPGKGSVFYFTLPKEPAPRDLGAFKEGASLRS